MINALINRDLINFIDFVLDLIQGIPLGLIFGSIPFLLQKNASYSKLAIFAMCGYPYSLKLLWSPLVDCFFSNDIHLIWCMKLISFMISYSLDAAKPGLYQYNSLLVACFFFLACTLTVCLRLKKSVLDNNYSSCYFTLKGRRYSKTNCNFLFCGCNDGNSGHCC